MIEYGNQRGFINQNKELKIHYKQESFWIKVVGINKEQNKVIGILMNSLLDNKKYVWGIMVMAKENKPDELCEMVRIVSKVPNTKTWTII